MAYKTIATRWLLSQKNAFNISFVEHKWNINLFSSITDIEIKIQLDHKTVINGRGTDQIGDLALEKASSEAIERWCCHKLKISSVGCAVHSNEICANSNSKKEFIERYFFNQFLDYKIKPQKIKNYKTKELSEHLIIRYPSAQICFWEISKSLSGTILLCLIYDNNKTISLGLACEDNHDLGIQKSTIEAIRNFVAYKTDPHAFIFIIKNNPDFWCCNPTLLNRLASQLELAPADAVPEIVLQDPEVVTKSYKVSELLNLQDCPLYFSETKTLRALI